MLAFSLDAIDDFYNGKLIYQPRRPRPCMMQLPARVAAPPPPTTPALAAGSTVWFLVRGAWHDGVVVESESYADCTNPYVTIREAGFKPATYHIAVADTYDLDEVLDRDPEYADWLTALERADEEWENRS